MNNGHERPRKHVSKATAIQFSNNNSESKIIYESPLANDDYLTKFGRKASEGENGTGESRNWEHEEMFKIRKWLTDMIFLYPFCPISQIVWNTLPQRGGCDSIWVR